MVGATTAYALMLNDIAAELILVDVNVERAEGEVHDLSDALPFSAVSKIRTGTFPEAGQADIIVITAGAGQKPGETRIDLFKRNKVIFESILKQMAPIQKEANILVVSNPVDLMTQITQELSGLPRSQVFGSGTLLDTQRLRGYLSEKLGVAEPSIHAYVVGEHGDSEFVAWSAANIAGVPLLEFQKLTTQEMVEIERKTKMEAYEIIRLKGATYYGIGMCVAAICKAMVYDQRRVIPVSCYVEKLGAVLGMPAVVGERGVERVVELILNAEEAAKLQKSAEKLKVIKNS